MGASPYYYLLDFCPVPTWHGQKTNQNENFGGMQRRGTKRPAGGAPTIGPSATKKSRASGRSSFNRSTGGVGSGPLGRTKSAELQYVGKFVIAEANLNGGGYVISANDCYDPDVTGIGSQPRGFDQMMEFFDHGVVTKTKVELWVDNASANAQITSLSLMDNVTIGSPTTKEQLEYNPQIVDVIGEQGFRPHYMKWEIDPNKYLGRKDPLSDPELKFSAVGGPTEKANFHFQTTPVGSISGGGPMNVVYRVTYKVTFMEGKQPSSS